MNRPVIFGLLLASIPLINACASLSHPQRVFVDSSSHRDSPPEWVQSSRMNWERDGKLFFKNQHSVRGDERINGCFDLAMLDSKEALLSTMSDEIRGSLDDAQQSISENAERVLGKTRSSEFKGKLSGLRFVEQYFERYRIADTERVDCHVLAEIEKGDYQRAKASVISGVVEADPRLKDAVARKQIKFFSDESKVSE